MLSRRGASFQKGRFSFAKRRFLFRYLVIFRKKIKRFLVRGLKATILPDRVQKTGSPGISVRYFRVPGATNASLKHNPSRIKVVFFLVPPSFTFRDSRNVEVPQSRFTITVFRGHDHGGFRWLRPRHPNALASVTVLRKQTTTTGDLITSTVGFRYDRVPFPIWTATQPRVY
jgi:hypothetical protein